MTTQFFKEREKSKFPKILKKNFSRTRIEIQQPTYKAESWNRTHAGYVDGSPHHCTNPTMFIYTNGKFDTTGMLRVNIFNNVSDFSPELVPITLTVRSSVFREGGYSTDA